MGADGWSVEIVDADVDTGRYSAFAYDANGNPQISYLVARNRESGTIRYASWDGEQFTDLIKWTVDANIAAGPEVNQRLGVWAEGDRLVLYVNGFEVGEVQDSTYMAGTFGVTIAAAENEGFTVDVTEAKTWDIPQ